MMAPHAQKHAQQPSDNFVVLCMLKTNDAKNLRLVYQYLVDYEMTASTGSLTIDVIGSRYNGTLFYTFSGVFDQSAVPVPILALALSSRTESSGTAICTTFGFKV